MKTLAESVADVRRAFDGMTEGLVGPPLQASRSLREQFVDPPLDLIRWIDAHAGPAVVGIVVLTGIPLFIVFAPILIVLTLIGAGFLKLTGTTATGRRPPR